MVNEDTENSNIYANGYKLYVGGVEATINQGTPPEYAREEENSEKAEETTVETKEDKTWLYWLLGALGVAFVAGIIIVFIIMKKGKKEKRTFEEKQALSQVENNGMKKPWEQEQPLQKPTDKNA